MLIGYKKQIDKFTGQEFMGVSIEGSKEELDRLYNKEEVQVDVVDETEPSREEQIDDMLKSINDLPDDVFDNIE